ncbi:hypothetical protein [Bradyrhizobium sp. Tv2a-2]|uniref:hypothetical protein n=1 Tax=Bradyrhizobium sp. Tv2a-2 TaxID=113395 RepID=UPI0004645B05|nr:hypothetical protein [Bradyrhizobium sp. Tv2a-2]
MRIMASLAATAILLSAPLVAVLAQSAPDSGTPAAPAEAAPAPVAPAAPAVQTPTANPPASTTEAAGPAAANPPAARASDNTPKTKKKKAAGMTRRQEIDRSIDTGTVPSRYRSSVPKEYQQYIPFSKN